jgi:hypothetical protein
MQKMGRPYLGNERDRLRGLAQIAGVPDDAGIGSALARPIDRVNFAILAQQPAKPRAPRAEPVLLQVGVEIEGQMADPVNTRRPDEVITE